MSSSQASPDSLTLELLGHNAAGSSPAQSYKKGPPQILRVMEKNWWINVKIVLLTKSAYGQSTLDSNVRGALGLEVPFRILDKFVLFLPILNIKFSHFRVRKYGR